MRYLFKSLGKSIYHLFKTLLSNKTRTFLTMFGIVVGVAGVIIIMSVGAGAQALVLSQVKSLGSNIVGILPGNSGENGPPSSVMGIIVTSLKYKDLESILDHKNVPSVIAATGYLRGVGVASWQSNTYDTALNGVTHGYLTVENSEINEGRFITELEEKNMSKGVVIGSQVKKELFGNSEAVGQNIKIREHTFEVIGVLKEKGTSALGSSDDQILIPLVTMQKLLQGVDHLGMIRVKINDGVNLNKAIEDIRYVLRTNHDIRDQSGLNDDFTVRSSAQALTAITTVTDSLRYFLALIAALSLVVGGIGIMNIMIVSVTERTREIGLRKAIGANNSNILNQFLLEATSITTIGGIIGIVLGILITFLIYLGAQFLGYKDWEFIVTLNSVLMAAGVSVLIGLIFGVYPARRASMLEPVESLRYE